MSSGKVGRIYHDEALLSHDNFSQPSHYHTLNFIMQSAYNLWEKIRN